MLDFKQYKCVIAYKSHTYYTSRQGTLFIRKLTPFSKIKVLR
jgi:predicted transcriptional regulator